MWNEGKRVKVKGRFLRLEDGGWRVNSGGGGWEAGVGRGMGVGG